MGTFLEATEMKQKSLVPTIQTMELDDLDDLFIFPAERMIAEACNLGLNTDGVPWRWAGRFETPNGGPRLLAEYQADYRLATIQVVNRMAANPLGQRRQTVRGMSMIFGSRIPGEVKILMKKWSAPKRIFRTS
jgi:hypothetical protein